MANALCSVSMQVGKEFIGWQGGSEGDLRERHQRSSVDHWRASALMPRACQFQRKQRQGRSTGGTLSSPPATSLPKGGCHLGDREVFSVNPVTDTGSLNYMTDKEQAQTRRKC